MKHRKNRVRFIALTMVFLLTVFAVSPASAGCRGLCPCGVEHTKASECSERPLGRHSFHNNRSVIFSFAGDHAFMDDRIPMDVFSFCRDRTGISPCHMKHGPAVVALQKTGPNPNRADRPASVFIPLFLSGEETRMQSLRRFGAAHGPAAREAPQAPLFLKNLALII